MNCACDAELAHNLRNLAPIVYNDDFQDFDYVNKCKASSNTSSSASNGGGSGSDSSSDSHLECCGNYPDRFEFSTQGGARSCCGSVTYNPNQHDCCDGSLKDLGTCDL